MGNGQNSGKGKSFMGNNSTRQRRAYSAITSRVPQDHMAWLNTFIAYRWQWLTMLSVLVDGDCLKCCSICIKKSLVSTNPSKSQTNPIIAQKHSSQRKAQGISIQLQQDSIALGAFMHQHTGRKMHATCLILVTWGSYVAAGRKSQCMAFYVVIASALVPYTEST